MEAMLAASQPGAREIDVASAAHAATIAAGGVPYSISLATGPNEDRLCPWTLPTWSSRTLRAGIWHCDLAGIRGGYLFDFARTTVVGGAPDDEQLEMMEAAIATVEAVIALIEPGRPIGDAVAQGHAVQRRLAPFAPAPGKHDYPHLGHTLGLGFGDICSTRTSCARSKLRCTSRSRRLSADQMAASRCLRRTCSSARTVPRS